MFRFIIPIILIGIAFAGFFTFVNPIHKEVISLQAKVTSYNTALDNATALRRERDKLTKKNNSLSLEDLNKLEKLLPNNVDNIRLIIEIGEVALLYDMVLKDVKYNIDSKSKTGASEIQGVAGDNKFTNKDYGMWDLEFSTEGSYENFFRFIEDLESNLRIVDIASIEFSSASVSITKSSTEYYRYNFKIRTYWLKN
ncbi:MAG: hypothetical protein AAB636_00235 [Patescibacteria group bacterium]